MLVLAKIELLRKSVNTRNKDRKNYWMIIVLRFFQYNVKYCYTVTTFLDFRFCCRNILWLFTMLRSIDSISWCPFYHRYTYYSLHIYNTLYYFYVISFSWKLCVRVGALEHLLWELIIKNGNYSWIKLRISSDEHQLYSTMFEKCMLALKNKIVLII